MDPQFRFGLSVVLSFLMWGLAAKYYFWPALRRQPGRAGFRPILLLQGVIGIGVDPGQLGAMYFVPTVIVPLLLVTHFLAFRLLVIARPPN